MTWNNQYYQAWKQIRKNKATEPYIWTRVLVNEARKRNLKKGLDVGCALGYQTRWLADQGFEMTGIDTSDNAITDARKQHTPLKFIKANAEDMPFKNNEFDFILCSGVLQYNTQNMIKKIMKEIKRVLKPKGIVLINFPLHATEYNNKQKHIGTEIEERTFTKKSGYAEGLPYHLFTLAEINELLTNMKIIMKTSFHTDIKKKNIEHYWLRIIGEKK